MSGTGKEEPTPNYKAIGVVEIYRFDDGMCIDLSAVVAVTSSGGAGRGGGNYRYCIYISKRMDPFMRWPGSGQDLEARDKELRVFTDAWIAYRKSQGVE